MILGISVSKQLTLCENSDGLAEVTCLTISSSSIFQHARNKAEFAKQAVLAWTICGDMRFCESPNGQSIVHDLDNGVCVRVEDVGLKSAEVCLVVKSKRHACSQYRYGYQYRID